jgi:hypothetical protein
LAKLGTVLRQKASSLWQEQAKEACGIDQLCAGLEAGIEGGIHAMQALWDLHETEENWGFLLIQ